MIALAWTAAPVTLCAQNGKLSSECINGPDGASAEVCQATIDLLHYIAPQLGATVGGGNTEWGEAASLARMHRVTLSLRVNVLQGSLPAIANYVPPGTYGRTTFDTRAAALAVPLLDAAVDVFDGLRIGPARVGAVKLLLSGAYLHADSGGSTSLTLPNGSFGFGYGARIVLVPEGPVNPAVAVSWIRQGLPQVRLRTRYRLGVLAIDAVKVRTTDWQLTASKSVHRFGFTAGVGQDSYTSSGAISKWGEAVSPANVPMFQNVRRTRYSGCVSRNIFFATLFAELGGLSGGKIETFNSFTGKASSATRTFRSVGIRVRL